METITNTITAHFYVRSVRTYPGALRELELEPIAPNAGTDDNPTPEDEYEREAQRLTGFSLDTMRAPIIATEHDIKPGATIELALRVVDEGAA